MLLSNIPYKFVELWAAGQSGSYITPTIPDTIPGAAASQRLGFPSVTALPTASGGTPPNIADFNGVFQYLSAWIRWQQAGGPVQYDSTFQSNVTGYPIGSVVQSTTQLGLFWFSTVDGNTTNPDTGGAGWVRKGGMASQTFTGSGTFTAPINCTQVRIIAIGGGGGGANCQAGSPVASNNCSGAGGGAGAYVEGIYAIVPSTGTLAIVVGAGGGPQATGGATTVTGTGVAISAGGGVGAVFQGTASSAGAAGGTGTGGNITNQTGGFGTDGQSSAFVFAGDGASGPFGGAGRAGARGVAFAGQAAGAGGGGTYDAALSGTVFNGGSGAGGIVIVQWFT